MNPVGVCWRILRLALLMLLGSTLLPRWVAAADVLVSRPGSNQVERYSGMTGAFLATVVASTPVANRLDGPFGLAFGPDGDLYVNSQFSGSVLRYDGSTGQFREVVLSLFTGGQRRLDNDFRELRSLAFGPDDRLYVNDRQSVFVQAGPGRIVESVSLVCSDFLTTFFATPRQPKGLLFGPDGRLYVSSFHARSSSVLRYDEKTGELLDIVVNPLRASIRTPYGLAFGPDGHLYVSNRDTINVQRYNSATGESLGAFVPAGSGGLSDPRGLIFGADNHLYVSSFGNDRIVRYDGQTGDFLDTFVPSRQGGLNGPVGLVFGPDGHLYVSSALTDSVLRYNGQTGTFLGVFVTTGSGGLDEPDGLVFGPDSHLYVSSSGTNNILRYDGQTGAFLNVFVSASSGGLTTPSGLVFDENDLLYVSSSGTDNVLLYDSKGGFLGNFVRGEVLLSLFDLTFGPDAQLFMSGFGDDRPCNLRNFLVDQTSGEPVTPVAGAGLTIGPDSRLYVSSVDTDSVLRYALEGRQLVGPEIFIASGSGGLRAPGDLLFGPDAHLYVSSLTTSSVLRYDGRTGRPIAQDPFDLRGRVVLFTPNTSGGHNVVVASAPSGQVVEPNIGNGLNLEDDEASFVAFTQGFGFPFFGTTYAGVFVSSNGLLTFTTADSTPTESLVKLTQQPLIAPFFDDLAPGSDLNRASDVFVQQFPARFVITYNMVPEFPATGANTFQVVLFSDGRIQFSYDAQMTALDGLVGISPGALMPPQERDLSTESPLSTMGPSIIFELFRAGLFFVEPGSGGLQEPKSLTFGPDGDLYVSSFATDKVLRYNGQSGEFVEVFAANSGPDSPQGMALGMDGTLYVSSASSNSVLRYNSQSRAFIDIFVAPGSGGLASPQGLVLGRDGQLYVSSADSNSVLRYDSQTGHFLDAFVASGSGGLLTPQGLVFGPDNQLYVSSAGTDSILRYDGQTGAFRGAFVASGSGGLATPHGLVFGPDGDLYVSSTGNNSVLRYDGQTGAFLEAFIPAGRGGLAAPHSLLFDLDGHLYVSSMGTGEVLRYDSQTGQFLDVFIAAPANGINAPTFLLMFPTRPEEIAVFTAGNCAPDGLVTLDSALTPADALLTLQHYLGTADPALNPCQQSRANVIDTSTSSVTPADAQCILQRFLGLSACIER